MHPFLSNDFAIRWSTLVPDAIESDISLALKHSKQRIDSIANQVPETASYASTFEALEQATEELSHGWGRLNHLDSVRDEPAQREALNRMLPEVSDFFSSIPLNTGLWTVIKAVASSPEVARLDPVRKRHVEETVLDFQQSGADLSTERKARISVIEAELSRLTKQYAEHVLDSTNAWELVIRDEAKLDGLPASAIAAAQANAMAKGLCGTDAPAWRFTLQAPSMMPVMQYLHDGEIRKQVWQASSSVASSGEHDNSELVGRIVALRQEKAELLGSANFADFVLQRRMAKNGSTALGFIEDLHAKVRGGFLKDYRDLVAYKADKTGEAPDDLEPWDVSYWAERRRKELFDLDDEELRPYFPVDGVMRGMFEIATRLFGINIKQRETIHFEPGKSGAAGEAIEVWHPEVSFFEINDATSGAHLGSFYADWHPRESKRGGAWMNSLHTGKPGEPHLGLIIGNMSPPVDGKTALLTHGEVETIFHEFGHLLHGMLSDVPVKALSGTNVPWDFVELPSQIMENFCWERESLDFFARHHETGEPIPDVLFSKMVSAKNYMSATAFMRQLAFAKLDLALHVDPSLLTGRTLDAVDREILAEYRAPLKTEAPTMLRRFNHLFSSPTGYAAGYYSYKWAEVLDADAFTRFQREGVLNPETGASFRREILSKGNSAPVDELYRNFMGHDPELEPLLVRSGLLKPAMA
jgi:oligopeptidase A